MDAALGPNLQSVFLCGTPNPCPDTAKLLSFMFGSMDVRPRVTINCAMSVDGKIAYPGRRQARISNKEDLRRVHRLRARSDAILVGIGTVLADDPSLLVKREFARGRNPIRVVVDSHGRTPPGAKVLDGSAPTIIVTVESCRRTFSPAETARFGRKEVDLKAMLEHLWKRGVRKIMVEGGSTILWSFLSQGLADELKVFVGSLIIGGESSPTLVNGKGASSLASARNLRLDKMSRLGDGILLEYSVVKGR